MVDLLKKNRQKDRMLQYTGTGIQRDDVQFSLEGHPLKVCGSQGQQKTYLLALKLAQFALIRQMKELAPILLLDDVFDKLDARRVSHLLHLVVEDGFGQIFLTDSNKVRIEELIHALGGPHTIYSVKGGVFTHEKTKD
jgi:DNA replication and repair protein RecF